MAAFSFTVLAETPLNSEWVQACVCHPLAAHSSLLTR
jgi:hypothetical protein